MQKKIKKCSIYKRSPVESLQDMCTEDEHLGLDKTLDFLLNPPQGPNLDCPDRDVSLSFCDFQEVVLANMPMICRVKYS